MKSSEIAMIVLIASVSVMVAFFIANSLPFLKVDPSGVKVPTIEKIEPGIPDEDMPSPVVFDPEDAINPTVRTTIGRNN